ESRLRMINTVEWTDEGVRFIDQRRLPTEEVYVTCSTYEQVAEAIRNMTVRGAPAIGVTAAMGVALGMRASRANDAASFRTDFDRIAQALAATRPTAVNLFWGIERMRRRLEQVINNSPEQIKQALTKEAQQMHVEDIAACRAMGRHGA